MKDGKKMALGASAVGLGLLGIYLITRPAKPAPGLANLYGIVTEATTGEPLVDVLVTVDDQQTVTDSGGYYEFIGLHPGTYDVIFQKEGYEEIEMPVTLSPGESRELNVQMTPLPPPTATLFGTVTDAETGAPVG